MPKGQSIVERFESRVMTEPNSGCWIWIGGAHAASKPGHPMMYGRFWLNGKTIDAHDAAWKIYRGDDFGLCKLHKCDVSLCVNPDHLFLGTKRDNTRDMVAKRRHGRMIESRRGERGNFTKLTREQVIEIRRAVGLQSEIAQRYGISQPAVSVIKSGKNWGWLRADATVL